MVGKVCLSEDMLDVYVLLLGELLDSCLEANSSPVTTFATPICGHTGTHTIHSQLQHVGTTGKGYSRTVFHFVMFSDQKMN